MKITTIVCNHCGKEIDDDRDYCDEPIDMLGIKFYTDLCLDCAHELEETVTKFAQERHLNYEENN